MKLPFIFLFFMPTMLQAQVITTFAGMGVGGGTSDGVPATAAHLYDPGGGVFDKYGNYYFADAQSSHRIRKIDVTGTITTVVGNGSAGFVDGVVATSATLNSPWAVRLDTFGNLYIADGGNNRIRKVNVTTGIITTIVGNGTGGFGGDGGPATAAIINDPNDICFDKWGNLYIADLGNQRVRKIDAFGIITTFAGTGGISPIGDGGPATDALLNVPQGLAADDTGNIYIADASTNRVRKVNTAGIITTVAGNGTYTYIGDNIQATNAQINPVKVTIDNIGQLFIADAANVRVYKVDLSGIIHLVAGNGVSTFAGDGGLATAASLNYPSGVCFDVCGNLYVPEPGNKRIRKITYPPILTEPTINITGPASEPAGSTVTVNATVSNAGSSYMIEWYNRGIEFTTTTVPSVTYTKAAGTDTITARVVSTATYGCYDSTTSAPVIVSVESEALPSLSEGAGLSVYPNPVGSVLHITMPQIASYLAMTGEGVYCVMSIEGRVMLQGVLHGGSNNIPVQQLPAGLYMVVLRQDDKEGMRVVKKFIKE